ncbi:sulfatase family protein [Allorhodopirellula heiligendammensis]|uniref:Arylsulfatase n=1 Tax=Allorhodopirellula heiligendammensis TaxID=2714739 RepID=A0A5C6C6E2_9BACT|nr:sulfatase [Allorhodopirellula heiligendammensis]TWU19665.1 Arylsulfatase [Allorhodopirellula heiligendammensis]
MQFVHAATPVILALALSTQLAAPKRSAAAELKPTDRPNFVLIIADDIGFRDIGCYGSANARTPRLDELAGESLRLTNAFLTASSCSPSRASIITGRYPHNNGPASELHKPIPWHLPSVTGVLRANGYYTALSGKNHLSWDDAPQDADSPPSAFDHIDRGINKNASVKNTGGHGNWVQTIEDLPADQPFMLWLASFDAHRNWDADGQWDESKYGPQHRGDDLQLPPAFVDTPATRDDFASYLNEVTRFDHYVGEVIDKLKADDLWSNTYLFVLADNGRPFPRGKTRLNDDGMQTFLFLAGPTLAAPGTASNSLVSVIDIAPTILDLAKVDRPETFQGRSLTPLYTDSLATIRPYAFSEHNWHDYEALGRAVRDDRFLYVQNDRPQLPSQGPADSVRSPTHQDLLKAAAKGSALTDAQADVLRAPRPAQELYDRQTDPFQTNNLISLPEYASTRDRLAAALLKWRDETGDSAPDRITPDGFDRQTGLALKLGKKKRAEANQPPPGHDREATRRNAEGI